MIHKLELIKFSIKNKIHNGFEKKLLGFFKAKDNF